MAFDYDMEYLSPADYEIAKQNGISYKQAYERYYSYGWTREDAITKPIGRTGLWTQYKELCVQNGVLPACFYKRIKKGMAPDKAATTPPTKKQRLFKEVKITQAMIEQAKANGIKPNTFKYRVYKCKYSVERAMTEPVDVSKHKKSRVAQ